jgi:glutathione peroxidase-family protein
MAHFDSFHEFAMDAITGESVRFSRYADQVCLVVNVASR